MFKSYLCIFLLFVKSLGVVQESSNGSLLDEGAGGKKSDSMSTPEKHKVKNHVASTSSETLSKLEKEGQPHSNRRGSKLPQGTYKEEKESVDPWWSKLPYVLVSKKTQSNLDNIVLQGLFLQLYVNNVTCDVVKQSILCGNFTRVFSNV